MSLDLADSIDLADTQLVSKYNIEIQSLLFAINVFQKYAGIAPLKKKMHCNHKCF